MSPKYGWLPRLQNNIIHVIANPQKDMPKGVPRMYCMSFPAFSAFQLLLFPTCQVRVARSYQSCSSSSPSYLSSSPILFANLLVNPLRQPSRQSFSPAPDRSVHRWTSSARVRSQCAPLDLNRQTECQNICQKVCQNICQI